MTRNSTEMSTFLVHESVQKYSRFASLRHSGIVVPGGTVAPRRTKGIDTPPPAGLTFVNMLNPCSLSALVSQTITTCVHS
jgi:hypothetical protein